MIILLPMIGEAAEQGIAPVGRTHHERRRAAAVFAMKKMDIGIPANVLSLITSEPHETHEGMETGFYPWNEWKSLKLVFHRNERTASLFEIVNKYDDAVSAKDSDKAGGDELWNFIGVPMVRLDQKDRIQKLGFCGLADADFRDPSRLPSSLKELVIHGARDLAGSPSLTQLPPRFFSQLPRGLVQMDLSNNMLSDVVVESAPPSLRRLLLWHNAKNLKVRLRRPLPMSLTVYVDSIDDVDPDDGELVQEDGAYRTYSLKWDDGTQIKIKA